MAAQRECGALAEWRAMLTDLAAAVAASGKSRVVLEVDVTMSDGTRLRARGHADALPVGCAKVHGGGGRLAQHQRRAARPSGRPVCRGAPKSSGEGDRSVEQPHPMQLHTLAERKRKSILRLAAKVRARKLVAVARLAPALAAWVRRVRTSHAPGLPQFVRLCRQRMEVLRRKAAMAANRKRDASEAPAALEGGQLLSLGVGLYSAAAPEGSPAKRQSRPSSRADSSGVT